MIFVSPQSSESFTITVIFSRGFPFKYLFSFSFDLISSPFISIIMSSNEVGFSLFPYQYVSSRVIAAAAAAASASSTPNALLQSPSYFGNIVVQFTRQVMRPKVVLPMLFVIVMLFDLEDAFDLDDDFFLSDDEEEQQQQQQQQTQTVQEDDE